MYTEFFSCLVFVQCVALWPKEVQKLELFAKYAKTEECSVPFSCKETNFVLLKIPNKVNMPQVFYFPYFQYQVCLLFLLSFLIVPADCDIMRCKYVLQKGGMYMNCQVGESAAVVGFSDYEEGLSPVLMVNHSSMTLTYCQA